MLTGAENSQMAEGKGIRRWNPTTDQGGVRGRKRRIVHGCNFETAGSLSLDFFIFLWTKLYMYFYQV